jgi:GTP cyclohydrolase IA
MSDKITELSRELLKEIGENPEREGLKKTPERMSQALKEITTGYSTDVDKVLNNAFFNVDYKEMVIVKDINFYSLCEHHMLPFFGTVHVAYIPDGKIIGLSKIPRLVEAFSKRMQIQERLTMQIADTLYEKLKPKGVGVVIEAQHLCMTMRGVKNKTAKAVTSSMLGSFLNDNRAREEFLLLIKNNSQDK